jgi:hypothetical protein
MPTYAPERDRARNRAWGALFVREAASDWIDKNQLGRRNLTPDAFRLLLGRRLKSCSKVVDNQTPTPKSVSQDVSCELRQL